MHPTPVEGSLVVVHTPHERERAVKDYLVLFCFIFVKTSFKAEPFFRSPDSIQSSEIPENEKLDDLTA